MASRTMFMCDIVLLERSILQRSDICCWILKFAIASCIHSTPLILFCLREKRAYPTLSLLEPTTRNMENVCFIAGKGCVNCMGALDTSVQSANMSSGLSLTSIGTHVGTVLSSCRMCVTKTKVTVAH